MGRATEFFDYINREKTPTKTEIDEIYFSLSITEDIKKARKEYRKELKDKECRNENSAEFVGGSLPLFGNYPPNQ